MKLLILFAIVLSIAVSCSSKKVEEEVLTEQGVMAVVERFDEGWKNKNKALVDSVLSDQYLYFTQ
jgi:hypothetical protein